MLDMRIAPSTEAMNCIGSLLKIALAAGLWIGCAALARADIFILHSGGQVRGELVNRSETPRKNYEIKLPGGGQVTLEAAQVKEVKRQSAAEMKYDQIRGDYPDTVEGQWKLAEWCRENYLVKQRKTHLERIIELDPDHVAARRGLGYTQVQGRWVTQEMLMTQNGYVRYKNTWVLPQEVEIKEQEAKSKSAQLEWNAKLKRWHTWLATDKADQAEANIRAIEDPYAAPALARMLTDGKDDSRYVRLLYIAALGRLDAASGMEALVNTSLFDPDEEVRLAALDQVAEHKYRPAVGKYIKALKNNDNAILNRAAIGLAQMKDPSAIGPLIDALVTVHTHEVEEAPAGQMSSTFGRGSNGGGGGTFNFGGGGPKIVKQQYENREVLQALVVLSNGVSFNFDRNAWKYWLAAQKKPQTLDPRRDNTAK
jgi:hypothetical protein